MSSIKSTQIDGDVSVSRNAAVGGDVTVQGKTHLKGNVKIEGWIEAKNIKAANKGLFTTIEKLKAAYPFPHDGWWALVGLSLPAPIYVGDGGEWVATGQTGGNPSIDSGKFNEAVEKRSISALEKRTPLLNIFPRRSRPIPAPMRAPIKPTKTVAIPIIRAIPTIFKPAFHR